MELLTKNAPTPATKQNTAFANATELAEFSSRGASVFTEIDRKYTTIWKVNKDR